MLAVSVGGWVGAAAGALAAIRARRTLGTRMEAVARACHELRGPLTAARLGLALPSGGPSPSTGRLRAIDAELGRAALALDDLAHPAGEQPRLRTVEPVDVAGLLADSVEAWRASADVANVELSVEWSGARVAVWGDRARLAQAVGNLLANAIEHGGGPVRVRGSVARGTIRIAVSDRGPGLALPLRDLCRAPRRGRGARGRGLAIASAVADAHGGRLTC
ncbi:MAG: sensor histidine kinase, partial [Solirubrobacteraceae bacterium]